MTENLTDIQQSHQFAAFSERLESFQRTHNHFYTLRTLSIRSRFLANSSAPFQTGIRFLILGLPKERKQSSLCARQIATPVLIYPSLPFHCRRCELPPQDLSRHPSSKLYL